MKKTSFINGITILFLFFLIGSAKTSVNAQSTNKKRTFNISSSPDYFIESFKVIELNKKLYFKFLIQENNINIAYVLESSENGVDFKSIQIKEGFKSPNGVPLLYCYSEKLTDNNTAYRIMRISYSGDIDYSCSIIINKNKEWVSCIDKQNTIPLDSAKGVVLPLISNKEETIENDFMKLWVIQEDEVDIESNVTIYPNPNKGIVNVDFGNLKNISLRIYKLNGELIYEAKNISSSIFQFEFNQIPGNYLIDIKAKNYAYRSIIMKR